MRASLTLLFAPIITRPSRRHSSHEAVVDCIMGKRGGHSYACNEISSCFPIERACQTRGKERDGLRRMDLGATCADGREGSLTRYARRSPPTDTITSLWPALLSFLSPCKGTNPPFSTSQTNTSQSHESTQNRASTRLSYLRLRTHRVCRRPYQAWPPRSQPPKPSESSSDRVCCILGPWVSFRRVQLADTAFPFLAPSRRSAPSPPFVPTLPAPTISTSSPPSERNLPKSPPPSKPSSPLASRTNSTRRATD